MACRNCYKYPFCIYSLGAKMENCQEFKPRREMEEENKPRKKETLEEGDYNPIRVIEDKEDSLWTVITKNWKRQNQ